MRLTPWEEERLLIFTAAELARRHRAGGMLLNGPETVAIICDAMLEAARAGRSYAEVEAAGRAAVAPDEVMPGVRELVDEVRLEVLFGDGARLVVLLDPLGRGDMPDGLGPGAVRLAEEVEAFAGAREGAHQGMGERAREGEDAGGGAREGADAGADEPAQAHAAQPARERIDLTVLSGSTRVVRVSSHYPFHLVNPRLTFDRDAARGFRLDLPAGASERWAPGESKTVRLIRFGGEGGR